MALHVFTQEEFNAIPRDEYGWKNCPSGDYSKIKNFPNHCSFGEWCSFGDGANFGDEASFGSSVSFGKDARFGEWSNFGDGTIFGDGANFEGGKVGGQKVRMLKIDRIGSRKDCTYFWKHDGGIYVRCGCFSGDIDTFAEKVEETHAKNPQYLEEYRGAIKCAKEVFGVEKTQ